MLYLTLVKPATGRGRVQVALRLLEMLPPELASLTEPEEEATEQLHYRQFFAAWSALTRVRACAALEQPHMNKESRASWLADYKVHPVTASLP